ncbi:MAG: tRNA (5-methylaminomethyl-2-thiouridine)(34)-methyltransferase MnmD, partial [Granulosicoccus sp.]
MSDAVLTDDGSYTLDSQRYGQTYHSTFGALTEARHVFLDATEVSDRLARGLATRVLEIGFGLGLNALLTADLAVQHATQLDYHSFELELVNADVIQTLGYDSLLSHPALVDPLLDMIRQAHPAASGASDLLSCHHFQLNEQVSISLHLGDATLVDFNNRCGDPFQAIYLDAFSPDTNAECWSPEFIGALAAVLAEGGKLSTYSAKGSVRRAMLAAGLHVSKHPGPPGKREMLV